MSFASASPRPTTSSWSPKPIAPTRSLCRPRIGAAMPAVRSRQGPAWWPRSPMDPRPMRTMADMGMGGMDHGSMSGMDMGSMGNMPMNHGSMQHGSMPGMDHSAMP